MTHYFDERPVAASDRGEVVIDVDGHEIVLATDRGVFSRGRLDPGTAVLLRKSPLPPTSGVLLDLGCGYGPIACSLARRAPSADVWAVDVNERARSLLTESAAANDLHNLTVAAPDDVPDHLRFDAVYSNPPVRIGKQAMHDLLTRWLPRMTPTGVAYLVVQRHLGADSLQQWLDGEGFRTRRVASSKGYRVLEVRP